MARDGEALDRAAGELRETGAEVVACSADVTNEADVDLVVQAALDRFGRIDVLVNNAGEAQIDPYFPA